MIIGFDISRADRAIKTGVEWHAFNLVKKLSQIDHTNTYWLYTNKPLSEDFANLGENFIKKRLRWPSKYLWTQGRLSLEMLFRRPDVLFIPASIIPIIHPKKTVCILHDIAFRAHPETYGRLERLYQDFAVRLAIWGDKKNITVSEFTRQELIKMYGVKAKNISVIPIAYNHDLYHPRYTSEQKQQVLKKYKINRPYVFYVGSLSKKKNIKTIVRAFKLFRSSLSGQNFLLVLAGKAGIGFNEIKSEIKLAGISDDVILPGWVSLQDMPLLLSAARVFLFPSLYEGFGIPVLEAFACGVPVICSNKGSLPEVARGAAMFVQPEDVGAIYDALKRIIDDQTLRVRLINSGIARAKEFSYEKCARATLDFLYRL